MLLIVAALQEELKVALSHFRNTKKFRNGGVEYWRATRNRRKVHFLKTGVGPKRAAANLQRALKVIEISEILVVGYAGALDPRLKLGTLVVVDKALACSFEPPESAVECIKLDRTFDLAPGDSLLRKAQSVPLPVICGRTITTAHVWGNPEHKSILFGKFGASIVDMETAALADIAETNGIPLLCLRVVSDEAGDSFLEPFSYNPSAGIPKRAEQIIRKGNPVKAFREWRCNSSVARVSLNRFLSEYL
jgi:nucleoside phosphorylase